MERFKKLGVVNNEDTHHMVFYSLKDQMPPLEKPIYLSDGLKEYVDIYF